MKLEAWLRQQHTLADRLLVVERLSQALNELHDRGEPLPALQPDRIEVAGDGRCDLSEARHGAPAAGYAAPERAEGGLASPEADVYSAGAIAWEVLAGSPCGPSPTHLSEACPDLPQELADAVMACLERSPQWRPRDLTYLAQLAQHARGSHGKGPEAPAATARSARPAARPAAARAARVGPGRGASDTSATTRLRLAIGGVLALAAAGGAVYLWSGRPAGRAAVTPRTITPAAGPNALAAAAPATTLAATATAPPVVAASVPSGAPTPATAGAPPATTVARPTPMPTPTITAAPAAAASDTAARAATPATSATAGSAAVPATAAAAPPPVAPSAPAVALPSASGEAAAGGAGPIAAPGVPLALSAVSPLSVRRPGKVLLDLRGTGMHDGIRVRVLPLREAPRGISIVRQKCEGDTLVRVLLDLDAQVAPAAYAIAIEDADGRQTKPLTFTVTR